MNEQQTREKLQLILNNRINRDMLFTETKTVDGKGTVEGNIDWIKQHSDGDWDEQVASNRVAAIETSMSQD